MSFSPVYADEFLKQLKKYRSLKKKIERKVELLFADPYHNCKSEPLRYYLKGLRSARLTKNVSLDICDL